MPSRRNPTASSRPIARSARRTSQRINIARFDLVSIKLAVACAQTGSLTSAARECNLVLAAASRRIRTLEVTLGHRLFARHSRGLVPTAAGQLFVRRGLSVLQEVDELMQELTDLQHGVIRHIQLFSSTAAITQFLPPLIARYAATHPEVRIDVEEQVSDQVVSALRDGKADIGVFVAGPDARGLDVVPFRTDQLVLILPKGHRLAGRTPIAYADTLDEQWISLNAGAAMLRLQQDEALAAGRVFKLRMQVRSFDAVGHMVASGLGIAALPKGPGLPIAKMMGLTWRPLADPWAHRQISVGVRADADDAVVSLRNFLCSPSQIGKAASPKIK